MVDKLNLVKAVDGYLVVREPFKDRLDMINREYSRYTIGSALQNISANMLFDSELSLALTNELNIYESPIRAPEEFSNELGSRQLLKYKIEDLERKYNPKGYMVSYPNYIVSNDDLPDVMKDIGYKIKREAVPYYLEWNEKENKPEFSNAETGEKENLMSSFRGGGNCGTDFMIILDTVLLMKKDDHEAVMALLGKSDNRNYEISPKHIEFARIYQLLIEEQAKRKGTVVRHEMQHFVNALLVESRRAKNNSGSISVESAYKLAEHDEKSASLAEVLYLIEKYHKAGNYSDLSMFSDIKNEWIAEKLKTLPVDKRKTQVMDMDFIVSENSRNWNRTAGLLDYRRKGGQLERVTEAYALTAPVHKIGNDEDEYMKQRALMYRFRIYNPDSKKHEYQNLFRHVKEDVSITEERKTFFHSLELKVKLRRKKLEDNGINKEFIDKLKVSMNAKIDNNINEVDRFYINKFSNNGR